MCHKFAQDINGLINNIDQFYFRKKSIKAKYLVELQALLSRNRDRLQVLQEFLREPGDDEKSHQIRASPNQDDEAFKTVKGRKKKKKRKEPYPSRRNLDQKQKQVEVITSNKFDDLQTPQTQENEDVTEATAENRNVARPPPFDYNR
ncbi:hypothetical protein TNCV_4693991 [Trichonephila clavipes]|uniref:Uncharacterized protein n=1 Tax=Trichonephila clavipes TaxID=2585209 RepID=A0A8X6WB96_TRICX|nr:hypothetical protein TNCV_4693991 [Trichonephila clavipes]